MKTPVREIVFSFGLLATLGSAAWAQPDVRVVGPRVIDEPVWVYPAAADAAGLRQGEARAVLSISDEGKLTDFLVVGWTHPGFRDTVAQALPAFRFAPARVRNEPTSVRLPVTFQFEQKGAVVSMMGFDQLNRQMNSLTDRETYFTAVCPQERLDRPLTVATTVSPFYPNEMRERGERGSVTIDFYVDGEGRVRLPAADVGTHPSFARAAVAALEQWRFEPPTSQGRPVLVRAVQTFNFPAPSRPDRRASTE